MSLSSPRSSPAGPGGSPAPARLIVIDPALLDVLPADVEGNTLVESPEAETENVSDPGLSRDVGRVAVAFVANADATNWAVVSVSALRPGTWSDAFYRDWRTTYDEAACARSGGVARHAEATIAAHPVAIGTCANGVTTYHVHLEQGDLVVSMSALGERRYGEQLVAGLRPDRYSPSP
ncbi:MAG TPA: hypothetical protein VIV06_04770 [Candidatus Limnocylindrales bacterium]